MAIWSILQNFLCPFDIFLRLFGIFFPFWYVLPRIIWQTCRAILFALIVVCFRLITPAKLQSLLNNQSEATNENGF
jgi:hypothetical protein